MTGVLLAGLAVAVFDEDEGGATAAAPPTGEGEVPAESTTTSPPTPAALAEGQARLVGTVTTFTAEGAVLGPLGLPIEVTTDRAGLGSGATIEQAVIDGERSAIIWDAGRPLRITGDATGMALAPVTLEVDPDGSRLRLDRGVHGFVVGEYRIETPVAVGVAGLARPVDAVDFRADELTTAEFTGGAVVARPPGPLRVEGPGRLAIDGQLELTTPDGTIPVTRVDFGEGSFQVILTPVEGGHSIDATLQGPLTAT